MARTARAWRSPLTAVGARLFGAVCVLMPLLIAGCAPWHQPSPILEEVSPAGMAARVLIPSDLNVNPAETVVKPALWAKRRWANRRPITLSPRRRPSRWQTP